MRPGEAAGLIVLGMVVLSAALLGVIVGGLLGMLLKW